jgi:hypothetical protein
MNLKENTYTYLAIGIIAGLALTYAYERWMRKKIEYGQKWETNYQMLGN